MDRQRAQNLRRTASLTAATVLASVTVALLVSDRKDFLTNAEQIIWLLCNLLLLTSAWALYWRYRMTSEASIGWLAAAILSVAAHAVPFALLDAAAPAAGHLDVTFGPWSGLLALLPSVALIALAQRGRRIPRHLGPLVVGLLAGITTGVIRIVYLQAVAGTTVELSLVPRPLPQLVLLGTGIIIGVLAIFLHGLARGARICLAVVPVGLTLGYVLHPDIAHGGRVPAGLAASISLLSSILLGVVCLALLTEVLHDQRRRFHLLRVRAEETEAYLIRDEEVLHELRATVAGVSAASQLLFREDRRLSHHQRRTLETMLEAEMARLEQMLRRNHAGASAPARIDEIIGPLVVGQRSLGVEVVWKASGEVLVVDRARLAEAVHVLLTNAAHHAPGTTVTVRVERHPDAIEVIVSDGGAGIPPELRDWIFDRGIRGAASHGQGLGLHAARRLAHELNGSLTLAPPEEGRGACFVLRLPHTDEPEV